MTNQTAQRASRHQAQRRNTNQRPAIRRSDV
jgi:hypothetical protein